MRPWVSLHLTLYPVTVIAHVGGTLVRGARRLLRLATRFPSSIPQVTLLSISARFPTGPVSGGGEGVVAISSCGWDSPMGAGATDSEVRQQRLPSVDLRGPPIWPRLKFPPPHQ